MTVPTSHQIRNHKRLKHRDRWVYESCIAGVPLATIMADVRKQNKRWQEFFSVQDVAAAAVRHAKMNGLEPPCIAV